MSWFIIVKFGFGLFDRMHCQGMSTLVFQSRTKLYHLLVRTRVAYNGPRKPAFCRSWKGVHVGMGVCVDLCGCGIAAGSHCVWAFPCPILITWP